MVQEILTPIRVAPLPSSPAGRRGGGFDQRRNPTAAARRPPAVVDVASSLGMSVADVPPSVQEAVLALVGEVDRLRQEVEQARHFEAFLGAEADQHPVLSVFNRRAFQRELSRLLDASEREGLSASVACLHVGGLECWRLQHGLAARDAILQRCVELLRGALRQIDILGYLDGGDFALALAVAEDEGAEIKLGDIAALLANEVFIWNDDRFSATIRLGTTHFSPGLTVSQALAQCEAQIVRQ